MINPTRLKILRSLLTLFVLSGCSIGIGFAGMASAAGPLSCPSGSLGVVVSPNLFVTPTCRTCPSGQFQCSGGCSNIATDSNNCGACGAQCPSYAPACTAGQCNCPQGMVVCAGTAICMSPTACGSLSGGTCSPPSIVCSGQCLGQPDEHNCGGCNVDCTKSLQFCTSNTDIRGNTYFACTPKGP
jgi:hypothetical protein